MVYQRPPLRLEDRPKQYQADIIEIADAYEFGGKKLANRVFLSIGYARKYPMWAVGPISHDVRMLLSTRGIEVS